MVLGYLHDTALQYHEEVLISINSVHSERVPAVTNLLLIVFSM